MRAFTLVEMVVIILIVGLTAGYGVPGIINFVKNNAAESATLRLAETFRQARSLAIANNQTIYVCPIASSSACTTTLISCPCIPSTDWSMWKIYNANSNIKFYGPVTSGTISQSTAGTISFNTTGIPTATNTFNIIPKGCTGNNGRAVTISVSGLVQIQNIGC